VALTPTLLETIHTQLQVPLQERLIPTQLLGAITYTQHRVTFQVLHTATQFLHQQPFLAPLLTLPLSTSTLLLQRKTNYAT